MLSIPNNFNAAGPWLLFCRVSFKLRANTGHCDHEYFVLTRESEAGAGYRVRVCRGAGELRPLVCPARWARASSSGRAAGAGSWPRPRGAASSGLPVRCWAGTWGRRESRQSWWWWGYSRGGGAEGRVVSPDAGLGARVYCGGGDVPDNLESLFAGVVHPQHLLPPQRLICALLHHSLL